jgi:hypothetical protein
MDSRALLCCLVIFVAGCSAPLGPQPSPTDSPEVPSPNQTGTPSVTPTESPTPNQGNLSITVQNPQEGRYSVQVALVRNNITGFSATYTDGTKRTYAETTVTSLPPGALTNLSEIRPTNTLTATQINTTGRSRTMSRLPQPPGERTVFFAVFRLNQPASLWTAGTLRCDRPKPWEITFDIRNQDTIAIHSNC